MDQQPVIMLTKRDGRLQPFCHEKLLHSIHVLTWGLRPDVINTDSLVTEITSSLAPKLTSTELQIFAATMITGWSSKHPEFSSLAGRIFAAFVHKNTEKTFSVWVAALAKDPRCPFGDKLVKTVAQYASRIDNAIVHARDFEFSYASIRALAHTYLLRVSGQVIERPQYLYMRIAVAAHGSDIDLVLTTYEALSKHVFTPASPILFNAGTRTPNYASCFLYVPDTSTAASRLQAAGDLDTLWFADGGIGLTLASIPARRTHPVSQPGVLPLIKVYDAHTEYTTLHRQKRAAAATVYLPIWHGDVRAFVQIRSTHAHRSRVRHLYPGVWICDIFMRRLRERGTWSLFDPQDVPMLLTTYGAEFSDAYERYETTAPVLESVGALELWNNICRAQQETGTPFILYQDAINGEYADSFVARHLLPLANRTLMNSTPEKNNQKHLGIIHTSNLCTEVVQFSSTEETAVCTLASVAAARFVRPDRTYDFDSLHSTVRLAVMCLNALLDEAIYPTDACKKSIVGTRALGVGVQGLADAFMASGLPFHSSNARQLNRDIFETIYHSTYETSCELSKRHGPYPKFAGSPASEGVLQHDMWALDGITSGRYDFDGLRAQIKQHGLRNSVLTAQMPTASTAKLMGNFDGTDPYTSNVVTHRILSGDYTEICSWLVSELSARNLWNEEVRQAILRAHGSVQNITAIPEDVKDLFLTAWELDPHVVIDLAADRAPFIDQTQSLSLNISHPNPELLLNLQVHAWQRGLKTGVYYLRTQAPTYPLSFGVGDGPDTRAVGKQRARATAVREDNLLPPHCEGCSG